jgi:carbamoyltransferase
MRNYIGLSCSNHEPALAIVNSAGEVVFAEATERYQQSKRAHNCPPDDLNRIEKLVAKYCEPNAELVAAKTWLEPTSDSSQFAKILDAIDSNDAAAIPPKMHGFLRSRGFDMNALDSDGTRFITNLWRLFQETNPASKQIASANLRFKTRLTHPQCAGNIVRRAYDHHLTHAVYACYTSPFDEAVCAILDGGGEDLNARSFYRYAGGRITEIPVPSGHELGSSLGMYYMYLCWACGFDPLQGEEWKVMGLAPYGKFNREIYDLLRPMHIHRFLGLAQSSDYVARLSRLLQLRRPKGSSPLEAADLAFTGQVVFGELCNLLLRDLHGLGHSKNLILSGGCALNSSWNGHIVRETGFSELYVPSAPADDGNAIGAALLAYQEDHPDYLVEPRWQSPYLGESVSEETLSLVVKLGGLKNALPPGRTVPEYTAELLAAGKIVGWVQGRAEFGPRALGNRSILADPRDPRMKDRINARVKFREQYRPFAPSILDEHGSAYFENYQVSPYMERAFRFRPEVIDRVPAVCHEDSTGRLQTVRREWNPKFHDLIQEFFRLTGVPIVLNTSFNMMGKPIIHSVEDAVAVFCVTGLDALVIEDHVFVKAYSPDA